MKKFILLGTLLVGLFGCNFGCQVENTISSALAPAISKALNCTNPTAIQASVTEIINLTKICSIAECGNGKKFGVIASLVCPVVASTAVAFLGNEIPATWGCSTTNQPITTVVTAACELLPF